MIEIKFPKFTSKFPPRKRMELIQYNSKKHELELDCLVLLISFVISDPGHVFLYSV